MDRKSVTCLIAIPVAAMVLAAVLLPTIFGPSDNGLRCFRTTQFSGCEIRQSRFFGFTGNSSFFVPESSIRGAKEFCPTAKVGGHAGSSCNLYLSFSSGQDYLVASYSLRSQAQSAATRLNSYFRDASAQSIDIKEDVSTPILLHGVAPVFTVIVLFLGLRWWRGRRAELPASWSASAR